MRTQTKQSKTFQIEASDLAFRLRRALSELAASVRVDVAQPRVAARDLGLDKTLAWKVSKFVVGEDPVAGMSMLPGTASQRVLLKAFEGAGAPEALLGETRAALDEFERLVERHAGDRESFEVLLSSIARRASQAREAHRKQAFSGNSAIWGVHCRVRTWTAIIAPSASDPDRGDIAMVGSYIGMQRMRQDAEWALAAVGAVDAKGNQLGSPIHNLLPSQKDASIDPSLPEFCLGEMPSVRRELRAGGTVEYRMEGGEVGRTAAFDWAFGFRYLSTVRRWAKPEDRHVWFGLNVLVPAELAQVDALVHRDFWADPRPSTRVFSLLPGEPIIPGDNVARREVEVPQTIEKLGVGLAGLAAHDLPRYAPMIEQAIGAMGRSPADFAGFRVRMKYPILSTAITLSFPVEEKPAGA